MRDYPYMPGWRLNKESNKPAINHSVLMLTTHGVAEGEWDGNEWIQYRWSCKLKDSDVLYWIHLEDLTQLEKEGESIQQKRTESICPRCIYRNKTDDVCEYPYGGRDCLINENGVYECNGFEEVEQQEQPEGDLEKEFAHEYAIYPLPPFILASLAEGTELINFIYKTAHHFWNKGYNARKRK